MRNKQWMIRNVAHVSERGDGSSHFKAGDGAVLGLFAKITESLDMA